MAQNGMAATRFALFARDWMSPSPWLGPAFLLAAAAKRFAGVEERKGVETLRCSLSFVNWPTGDSGLRALWKRIVIAKHCEIENVRLEILNGLFNVIFIYLGVKWILDLIYN